MWNPIFIVFGFVVVLGSVMLPAVGAESAGAATEISLSRTGNAAACCKKRRRVVTDSSFIRGE